MLDRIMAFLAGATPSPLADDPQLAVAAVLVEAARMDDHFDPSERATIRRLLAARFGLDAATAADLAERAERIAGGASDLHRFTKRLVTDLDAAQRVALIEMMWEVVYADGVLDPDEDALVRRVAGLLYVDDRDRGAARLRVLARAGITANS